MPKIILWNRAWKPDLAARKKGKNALCCQMKQKWLLKTKS